MCTTGVTPITTQGSTCKLFRDQAAQLTSTSGSASRAWPRTSRTPSAARVDTSTCFVEARISKAISRRRIGKSLRKLGICPWIVGLAIDTAPTGLDDLRKRLRIQRLREMSVETGVLRPSNIAWSPASRHRDEEKGMADGR